MNPSRHDFFDPLIKIFKMNLFVVAGTMYLTIVNVSDHSDTFKYQRDRLMEFEKTVCPNEVWAL